MSVKIFHAYTLYAGSASAFGEAFALHDGSCLLPLKLHLPYRRATPFSTPPFREMNRLSQPQGLAWPSSPNFACAFSRSVCEAEPFSNELFRSSPVTYADAGSQ